MLDIQNLTLKYGQSQILNGVSLKAQAGEVTALMGTNGVGKTSLLKAIAGRHPYLRGLLLWKGNRKRTSHPLTQQRRASRMSHRGGKSFQ